MKKVMPKTKFVEKASNKKTPLRETSEKVKVTLEKAEDDQMMMFTESEDDSVDSEEIEDMAPQAKRLNQVFWRARNWVILNNQGLLKLLVKQ